MLICSLLLIIITQSLEASELPDVVIQKGKTAPFKGVLVSEPRYRAYSEAVTVAELYKTAPALDDCQNASLDTRDYLLSGAGGLVLGLVVGAFVAGH